MRKENDLIPINKDTLLAQYFDIPVIMTFTAEVKDFIIDYIILKSRIKIIETNFYDYSFIILPLCKALEKQIFNMFTHIGYLSVIPGLSTKALAAKMKNKKKLNNFKEYLEEHSIDKKIIDQAFLRIQSMSDFFHEHRNLPLHVDGKRFSTFYKAEITGGSILKQLNDFTTAMASIGINSKFNEIFGIKK